MKRFEEYLTFSFLNSFLRINMTAPCFIQLFTSLRFHHVIPPLVPLLLIVILHI
jgi:hypothetical protein